MTDKLLAFLRDIDRRDPSWTGIWLGPSTERSAAVKLGLIAGRKMKVGHGKMYQLTAEGRKAIR